MDAPPTMPDPDSDGLITLYLPVGAYELEKIFGLSANWVRATKQELREERE